MRLLTADLNVILECSQQLVQIRFAIIDLREALLVPKKLLYMVEFDVVRHALVVDLKDATELATDYSATVNRLELFQVIGVVLGEVADLYFGLMGHSLTWSLLLVSVEGHVRLREWISRVFKASRLLFKCWVHF